MNGELVGGGGDDDDDRKLAVYFCSYAAAAGLGRYGTSRGSGAMLGGNYMYIEVSRVCVVCGFLPGARIVSQPNKSPQ